VTEPQTTSSPTYLEQKWSKSGIAPLVQTDSQELGDKRLNPEESVSREREELLKVAAANRIWGQDELEDPERSAGPRMPYTELIRRLQKLNPAIKVRDGIPGNVALYFPKTREEWDAGSNYGDNPIDDFFLDHKYITGFKKEPLPEYAHVLLDSSLLPTREARGWRSVLLPFIKGRIITYQQAMEEFGDPSNDKRSGLFLEQIQKHKQI
jgi:hypothetical protein